MWPLEGIETLSGPNLFSKTLTSVFQSSYITRNAPWHHALMLGALDQLSCMIWSRKQVSCFGWSPGLLTTSPATLPLWWSSLFVKFKCLIPEIKNNNKNSSIVWRLSSLRKRAMRRQFSSCICGISICLVRRIGLFNSRGWAPHIVNRWRDAVSNRPTSPHTTEIIHAVDHFLSDNPNRRGYHGIGWCFERLTLPCFFLMLALRS